VNAAERRSKARRRRSLERARLNAGGVLVAVWLTACAGQVGGLHSDLTERAIENALHGRPSEAALRLFYAQHPAPLWIVDGMVRPEAGIVLASPDIDTYTLRDIVRRAQKGAPADLIAAEFALSTALIQSAAAARGTGAGIVFADPNLAPDPVGVRTLREAAASPSLGNFLRSLKSGNSLYAELAGAAATQAGALPAHLRDRVRSNLERLKALPPELGRRFVLVDIAVARLWLYEEGRPVASMPVVVGAAHDQTPLMVATISSAVLHPYWNVPPDLVSERIAPQVLAKGHGHLEALGMEALSGWTADARQIASQDVDWAAVSNGRILRVRQRQGPANTLGTVKFVMPNRLGIFLHDTPERDALAGRPAYRSAGCIRLEDADLLGRWLFAQDWSPQAPPETTIALPETIPIYLVYRSVSVQNGKITDGPDPYRLDTSD
jgi:murein L,D-transpeptidase YcbB/YkuD